MRTKSCHVEYEKHQGNQLNNLSMDSKISGSCYVCREKIVYASFRACICAFDYAYGSCLRNMIPNPFPHSIKFTHLINLSIQLFY